MTDEEAKSRIAKLDPELVKKMERIILETFPFPRLLIFDEAPGITLEQLRHPTTTKPIYKEKPWKKHL